MRTHLLSDLILETETQVPGSLAKCNFREITGRPVLIALASPGKLPKAGLRYDNIPATLVHSTLDRIGKNDGARSF